MSARHTPGPWGFCYDGSGTWSIGSPDDPQSEPPHVTIHDSTDKRAHANAALIAAAPDMLEALRKAVVLLAGACVHYPDLRAQEVYEAVSEAIAKATGSAS